MDGRDSFEKKREEKKRREKMFHGMRARVFEYMYTWVRVWRIQVCVYLCIMEKKEKTAYFRIYGLKKFWHHKIEYFTEIQAY